MDNKVLVTIAGREITEKDLEAIISQIEFAFHENLTLLMLFNVISWLVRTKT